MIGYRLSDTWTPKLDKAEALSLEFQQYAHCLETGERPRPDGLAGLRVVRILEAATQSLEGRGKFVELKAQGAGA
jgi:predicted dehydrogenase